MDRQSWLKPEPIECQDSAELLSNLDPSSTLWKPFEYGRWAFRGQADASWDLIPRAIRPNERLSFQDSELRAPLDQHRQIQAEWSLLTDFIELADEIGFQLPGDLTDVRFPWKRYETQLYGDQPWPPTNLLELAAIAQHHGVPTRLLDFTFNPLVAAYFAVAQPTKSDHLAVWAVDIDFIRTAWASFDRGIRVVQVSRGSNPFLHAQSGLFIYDAENNSNSIRQRILDHDIDSLAHIEQASMDQLAHSPRVRCLTVATHHRKLLLEQLAARRVTRAHIQPTLDNVVDQLWSGLSARASTNQEGHKNGDQQIANKLAPAEAEISHNREKS
ncbi:MAG: FRG domain-containing protein [Deltaproteobacteria bacterium]|nr:FRG domain-containing protein [Deltaproteobacteria bacterium]